MCNATVPADENWFCLIGPTELILPPFVSEDREAFSKMFYKYIVINSDSVQLA